MKKLTGLAITALGLTALPLTAANAQMAYIPASEIVGQPVQVTTNGITNTVYLDAGGAARVVTPNGTTMPASWTASAGKLCLYGAGGTSECWPYQTPLQAGQPVQLTSSCQATSQWLAAAVNPMPEPAQPVAPAPEGERGK